MNKKKLFFLALLAISSTSVSLFGMDDDSEKPNDAQNKKSNFFSSPNAYRFNQDALRKLNSEHMFEVNPNKSKANQKENKENKKDGQNNQKSKHQKELERQQRLERLEKLKHKEKLERLEEENNKLKKRRETLFNRLGGYDDGSRHAPYPREFYEEFKNDSSNQLNKPKKLFGYEIFNSQQQENKNHQNENDENPTFTNWWKQLNENNDSSEKKASNNNAYDYLSNMSEHRKNLLIKKATEEGFKIRVVKRIVARKPIGDALIEGVLVGFQQGVQQIVATTLVDLAKLGIYKGVEWWQQPSKEDLEQLTEAMQLNELLESLEKSIQAKQKLIIGNSAIINTVGQNVEQAQRIFKEQLNQKIEEFVDRVNNDDQLKEAIHLQAEEQKKEELATLKATFKKDLANKRAQKTNEFRQQHGILRNSSLSAEQSQKLNELIKELEKNMAEEIQQKLDVLEAKYAPENQEAQFIKEAVAEILQTSPETKFAQLYDKYLDSALNMFESQEKMMDGTVVNNIHTMFNKAARAA